MIELPDFEDKKKLFAFLVENKNLLIAQKKSTMKEADGFAFVHSLSVGKKILAIKANNPIENPSDSLNIKVIINTTNIMDSHKDVHLPGLWEKSLQENDDLMHLQEHKMAFDKIISDGNELDAFTKTYTWKELGFNFKGETQALVFDSNVLKDRNSFMHSEYAKGRVKNHSVGMNYTKIVLAINDESSGAEFEAWEKYYPEIVNQEFADKIGFFWAIKEAKAVEGSAVPKGSNTFTPTLENNMKQYSTHDVEPDRTTHDDEPNNDKFDVREYL